jgi:threonine dehydrogenase-like Zn-dependent dehydrogenase
VAVLGLGPIGQMAVRIAKHLGAGRVIGVDSVPERLALAERYGAEPLDLSQVDDLAPALIDLIDGRGPDSTIDAVGMESHGGAPGGKIASLGQKAMGLLPDAVAQKVTDKIAIDRLDALLAALKGVRRGGTVSISGVYGGEVDPLPMMEMFDRGITVRMGQAHVRRWTDDIMPLVMDPADPLGTLDLVTHRVPLDDAPDAYEMFRNKADGCIKVVLQP